VLYGCETWPLVQMEEHRLGVLKELYLWNLSIVRFLKIKQIKKLKIIDKRLKPEQIKNKRPQTNHKGTNYKPQSNIPGHTHTHKH